MFANARLKPAVSATIRRSQAKARLAPAPAATPLTAAITFFFKPKTAYEMGQWLEFRRVLCRSRVPELDQRLLLEGLRPGAIGPRRAVERPLRSEERRVGKEGRSPWAAGHQKKQERVDGDRVICGLCGELHLGRLDLQRRQEGVA